AGVACDRDTYTVRAQRAVCGLDQKTIDLLPSPGAGNEWAKSLKPDSATLILSIQIRNKYLHLFGGHTLHDHSCS
ncbi:jg4253, partial [Pararge aegeria aegeria]